MPVSQQQQLNTETILKTNRGVSQYSVSVERWMERIGLIGGVLALVSLAITFAFDALKLGLYSLLLLCLGQSAIFFWLRHSLGQQEAQLSERRAQLSEQLRESAAQEERNRLARDLHDTIKQQLFSINMMAATAQSVQGREGQAPGEYLQEVRTLAQSALTEMKALLTQLRPHPLDNIGLREAIREQLEALHFRAEVITELHCTELPDSERLPIGAQEALFRAVQESLSNIARHARASHVTVRMTHDEQQMQIEIVDDGQGFDPQAISAGMGLTNITTRLRELGGSATIVSVVGQGSTVRLLLPLFRQHPLVDEKLVEQRHRLAVGIRYAAALAALSATYLSFERASVWQLILRTPLQFGSLVALFVIVVALLYGLVKLQPRLPTWLYGGIWWVIILAPVIAIQSFSDELPAGLWIALNIVLLPASLVGLLYWWRKLQPLLPTSYQPWTLWADLSTTTGIGISLAGVLGILPQHARLGVAGWLLLLLVSLALLFGRRWALRHTLYEWTTLKLAKNAQNVKWYAPILLMNLLLYFNLRYTPPFMSWLLTNLHQMGFTGSFILGMVLVIALVALIGYQNQRWLLENYAAAERLQPTDLALLTQSAQPLPATPDHVKKMRWAARLLTGAYLYVGGGITWDLFTGNLPRNGGTASPLLLLFLFLLACKWYFEAYLTAQCVGWTRLGEQQVAARRYRKMTLIMGLPLSLALLVDGIVSAQYGDFFAMLKAISESIILPILGGGMLYLGMMVYFSAQRVRLLRHQPMAVETVAARDDDTLYAKIKLNWPDDDRPANLEERDVSAF